MLPSQTNLKELPQVGVILPSLESDSAASMRGDVFNMSNELTYEEWRWIKGYEGRYEISNRGRIRCWVDKLKSKFGRIVLKHDPHYIKSHKSMWGY